MKYPRFIFLNYPFDLFINHRSNHHQSTSLRRILLYITMPIIKIPSLNSLPSLYILKRRSICHILNINTKKKKIIYYKQNQYNMRSSISIRFHLHPIISTLCIQLKTQQKKLTFIYTICNFVTTSPTFII